MEDIVHVLDAGSLDAGAVGLLARARLSADDAAEAVAAFAERRPLLAAVGDEAGSLIGIAFGVPVGPEAILQGIAVAQDAAGRGIGSRLLQEFESVCTSAGLGAISLGSADGYVERFYRKNGYRVREYWVRLGRDDVDIPSWLDVRRVRRTLGELTLNVAPTPDPALVDKAEIAAALDAAGISTIFEKDLHRLT